MKTEQLKEIQTDAMEYLMKSRSEDGLWRGSLSSSAISTAVSVFALQRIDADKYATHIQAGVRWLQGAMKPDGSWGDSMESPSNMTATLLTYVSLYAVGQAPQESRQYLNRQFGGDSEEALTKGVLRYYGRDLTFSVPILMMCALAGVVKDWKKIPPFPFELATLPQRLFRYLNLPVVSYAIPALIAIGICQMHKKGGLLTPIRKLFVPKAMRVLRRMQPVDGGFLEAAPLTAFVSMCLAEGSFREHEVTQRCAQFLVDTVREDGSWPIDTNLSGWLTSLASKVLPHNGIVDVEGLANIIKGNATTFVHPFTSAVPGGWGWSDLSGSVPDGDDTSGALVALYHLTQGKSSHEVENGLKWLMQLQNNDGGMPTFCKGWGKLPFDRSTPDITAHAILAMGLWLPCLEGQLKTDVQKSLDKMLAWMEDTIENDNGNEASGWVPLWFGDQDATDEKAPVYGTATAIDYLMSAHHPAATKLAQSQIDFIIRTQNDDGGWGGNKDVKSKVTFTSRALAALAHFPDKYEDAKNRGWEYLYKRHKEGTLYEREPIGLYFSRLWYSEELYNVLFLLNALKGMNV
ncbi:MAG: squalene--hopene cyclase [Bacteroidaceae bacterium]|nr:squalene--hopene cyclase [Bacteroidaceae bacterium]